MRKILVRKELISLKRLSRKRQTILLFPPVEFLDSARSLQFSKKIDIKKIKDIVSIRKT